MAHFQYWVWDGGLGMGVWGWGLGMEVGIWVLGVEGRGLDVEVGSLGLNKF